MLTTVITLLLFELFSVRFALSQHSEIPRHLPSGRGSTRRHYSSVVAIGASWQDNGHARPAQYASTLQPAPYVGGRKTNGPVMVESLFDLTGAKHFYDFAYIGAHIDNSQTGGTVPDTKQQIANYSSQIDAGNLNLGHGRTLDVYWVGINSVLAIWYDEDKTQDVQGAFARISQAVESAAKQITELRSLNHGRRKHDLLMLPIPPLEVVPNPIFAVNGNATRLRLLGQLTQRYNDGIQQIYQSLKTQEKARESRVYTYDIVGLWRDVSHLPGKYGLKNVTGACWDSATGAVCAEPESYLYWDTLHPTTSFFRDVAEYAWARIRGKA